MLEMMHERMNSYIQHSISKIATTVSVIEVDIQRSVAEREAAEQLLNVFECTDKNEIKKSFADMQKDVCID